MTLEIVTGTLAEAYKSLRPESILHVDELMKERRLHPIISGGDLRNQCLYTADGEVYFMDRKTPTLAITRGSSNPLFQDSKIDEYCQQLIKNKNYRLTADETSRALSASDTVVVDLTKLRLEEFDQEFSYLAIDTRKYNTLNREEKKLAQRVYGKGQDFGLTMKMLVKAGINKTRVFVLNLYYVRTHTLKSSSGRASWLNDFSNYSGFNAGDRGINCNIRLRGVRREEVAQSAAPESEVPPAPSEITPARCYEFLLENPTRAMSALDDTKAAGLSRLLTDYLATRAR